ncbi:MAG: SLC13/DASS family transporter [Deltaproteobacteria bacterium]|nr:SLC13/DASS family transporter [Deltaproteobacteria bacterium]
MAIALVFAAAMYWSAMPQGGPIAGAIAVTALAAALWISEVLPLPVTAILIPVGLSTVGVFEVANAYASFGHPVLFLVLGGYALAAAVGANGVDRWIVRRMLERAGSRTISIVTLLMASAALLSMLISNTATTALLLPVAVGILRHRSDDANLARLLPLSIAYGASIGGVATVVGSPPNAIAAGLLDIGFFQWMTYALPVSVAMFALAVPILWWTYPPQTRQVHIQFEDDAPLSRGARHTLAILGVTFLLWLVGPSVARILGLPSALFSAAAVACLAMALLLLARCVTWKDLESRVQWGVLLLLGGGLSLGRGLSESGAADWLAGLLVTHTGELPPLALLAALVAIAVFATELISNTAITAKMAPVLIGVSLHLGVSAESLVVPVAIATSMAFMLPVATPPNAMVHASGYVSQRDMVRVGFRLNLAAIAAISMVFSLQSW